MPGIDDHTWVEFTAMPGKKFKVATERVDRLIKKGLVAAPPNPKQTRVVGDANHESPGTGDPVAVRSGR